MWMWILWDTGSSVLGISWALLLSSWTYLQLLIPGTKGLSCSYYPKIQYISLILCEIVMKAPSLFMVSQKKKDIWPSAEEGYRVLRVYVVRRVCL